MRERARSTVFCVCISERKLRERERERRDPLRYLLAIRCVIAPDEELIFAVIQTAYYCTREPGGASASK